MPSKQEIKKNARVGISKSSKTTSAKKSVTVSKPVKSKSISRKIVKTKGKEMVVGGKKRASSKTATKSLKSKMVITKNVPTIEQITARAHQMWLDEGCPEGRAHIHWQEAERELIEI